MNLFEYRGYPASVFFSVVLVLSDEDFASPLVSDLPSESLADEALSLLAAAPFRPLRLSVT
ncbi:MAG: hypothetical protein ACOC9E_02430 [Chloroflexota bacterium]